MLGNPWSYDTAQLNILSAGYQFETHNVVTEDGYILEVWRIPARRGDKPNPAKLPVLYQHGLMVSGASWIIGDPKNSSWYQALNQGHDVWIANSRGNAYANQHIDDGLADSLSSRGKNFWKFSFDHMAEYDLPATIDYILESTGHKKLHIVAHSQGCQVSLLSHSFNNGVKDKIASLSLIAPIFYTSNTKAIFTVLSAKFHLSELLIGMGLTHMS